MNPHSSKTMDDLKAEFANEDKKREEMEKAHRRATINDALHWVEGVFCND